MLSKNEGHFIIENLNSHNPEVGRTDIQTRVLIGNKAAVTLVGRGMDSH